MLKTLLGAGALVFAAPTLAQPVPTADPHAGHAEHNQSGAAQQGQSGEQQQQHSGHRGHGDGRGRHMMDCCKDCCGEDRQEGEKMPCCDKHGDAAPDGAAGHSQHGN